jgi:TorA-specific chaperone
MIAMHPGLAATPEIDWTVSITEWLAGLFMAPLPVDVVETYRGGLGAYLFDALALEPRCRAGAGRMRAALTTEESAPAIARRLSVAFTYLFDGVGGRNAVSPYESAYVGTSGRLFQKPTNDMGLLLRQSNLSVPDAFREPADHLSIELALLARLMREDVDEHVQRRLLDDHLLTWAPRFATECFASDNTGFYAGASELLTSFLPELRGRLNHVSPAPECPP